MKDCRSLLLDSCSAVESHQFNQAVRYWIARQASIRLPNQAGDRLARERARQRKEARRIDHLLNAAVGVYAPGRCTEHAAYKLLRADSSEEAARLLGFLRTAGYRLSQLIGRGRQSRSGLTFFACLDPIHALRLCPSPQRWERWIRKVRIRASQILAPWYLHPSWLAIGNLLLFRRSPGLPRVGRAALIVAGATLSIRFEGRRARIIATRRDALAAILRHRIGRGTPAPSPEIPDLHPGLSLNPQRSLTLELVYGPRGDDDRLSVFSATVVCACEAGAILRVDRMGPGWRYFPYFAQVVVTDPCSEKRHHLTLPPVYGIPLRQGETAAHRVHAAVAWTFGLSPEQYSPAVEV